MKTKKRSIALTVSVLLLIACFTLAFPASAASFSLAKSGSAQNINSAVAYQRYSVTSGENGNTVNAVAMEFNPANGYMPLPFMAYAGTSAVLSTQVSVANSKYGYEVAGAINGSFFSMDSDGRGAYGTLVDYVISNGKVMSAHIGDACEVVAFGEDGSFNVVNSCIDYKLYINGDNVGSLYYVNKTSGTKTTANWGNGFYYYDTSCGKSADTNTSLKGYNVLCRKLKNTDLVVGGTLLGEVISVTEGTAAAQISDGYNDVSDRFDIFVKSTSPNAAYVKDLKAGDSVNITVNETVEASRGVIENAVSVIGNVGWLVKDGVDQTQIKSSIGTHSVTYQARWTAFGVKADGSYVFFTSDSSSSRCVTLRDVAKAMISLGCVNVIRMDGGGSTAMYATNTGSGSAGYLMSSARPIADCILVVKTSSLADDSLTSALRSAANEAKSAAVDDDSLQAVLDQTDAYLASSGVKISGVVRKLLMKLNSLNSGKDELNAAISKADSIVYSDYSAYVLDRIYEAYSAATAAFGSASTSSAAAAAAADELNYWVSMSGDRGISLSRGKKYTVEQGVNYANPNITSVVDDLKRLTDGSSDSLEGSGPAYSAFNSGLTNPPVINIDLGETVEIDSAVIHAAVNSDWGIALPSKIEIEISENGSVYRSAASAERVSDVATAVGVNGLWTAYSIKLSFKAVNARYVRFRFATNGNFLWLTELEACKEVKTVKDGMYITGINTTVNTDYAVIFTSAAGNLNSSGNNTRYTQNVILKWSDSEQGYIVTSNSFGNGTAPDKVLASDEICFAVHGDTGHPGNVNRSKAAALEIGDKVAFYGVDISGGKITVAPYAVKVENLASDPQPEKYTLGDVDGDGEIDAIDYAMAKRAVLKTFDLDDDQIKRADVDKDGSVSAVDYAMIKRHVLGTYKIG